MNATAQQIAAMLGRRKQEIEMARRSDREFAWLFDAVELLLRIELERQEGAKP